MRSAYQVLGLPGNSDADDIEAAFEKARQHYSPARLAAADGAVEKFNDIQTAYRILKDPASRAAHDRKLAAAAVAARTLPASRAPAGEVEEDERGHGRYLKAGLLLVAVLFAAGFYVSHKNAESRKLQAAAELAARQQQDKDEQERQVAQQRADDERARARAKAEADERRLSMDVRASSVMASAERSRADAERYRAEAAATQAQRMARMELQSREAALQAEQRRQEYEAKQRIAADKQRIRELCWQNYRRADC
ncbi:MAG: DnaJ domain-containing protein [Pseudomonadota bacterium]